MPSEDYTSPSCYSCASHGDLESKVEGAIEKGDEAIERFNMSHEKNTKEHNVILSRIDKLVGDVNWIKVIGKWILVVMFGYFVAIGIHIFTGNWASKKDLNTIKKDIKNGEILHYQNEKGIESINSKMEILIGYARDKR